MEFDGHPSAEDLYDAERLPQSNASLSLAHASFPANNSTTELDLTVIIPLGIILSLLSLVTFAGNVMVLHAIRTEKKLQTVSNIFIMSLALADCNVGLFVMPISAVYALLGFWPFGLIVCNIWLVLDYVASTASIFNLFALSLDRFWSIISPLKYLKKRTRKRAIIMCSSVWILSCLWTIPVVGWHHFYKNGRRDVPSGVCDTEFAEEQVFKVVTAIFNFYVPMAAMIALYGRIFHEIRVRAKIFAGTNDAVIHPDMSGARKAKKAVTERHEAHQEKQISAPNHNGFILQENPSIPQIVVETPDDGTPGKPKRRRIVEYDGITLIHLSDKYSSSENIAMEKFEDVDVSVEFDDEDEGLDMMLRLPNHTVDDDCVSLSDYDLEEDEPEKRTKPAKIKKVGKGPRFPRLRKFSLTRRLSTSSRKLSSAFVREMEKPFQTETRVTEILVATRTVSDPTTPSPSSRKRLLTMLTKPAKDQKPTPKIDQPNKFKREKKAAFQLGVILGAFCLCFLPYFISFIITAFCPTCVSPSVHQLFTWLGYMNSTINPGLYPWTNANFRSAFRKMLRMPEPKKPVSYNQLHNKASIRPNQHEKKIRKADIAQL